MAEATTKRSPLHPTALVLASFVLAPFGTGIVLAVNDSRLGRNDRAPLTFYLFFFVALVSYLVLARLHADRIVGFGSRSGWLFARVLLGWVALSLAWGWSRSARVPYAQALRAGGRPGNPLPVCMPALLASVTLDVFVWQLFMRS